MISGNLLLLSNLTIWLTPFWLLTLGITLGLVIVAILLGILCLVWRKGAAELPQLLKEGILQPLLWIGVFLAGFTLVASFQMPVQSLWDSARRVFSVGSTTFTVEVPKKELVFPAPHTFHGEELKGFTITSDQDVIVGAAIDGELRDSIIMLNAGEPAEWQKQDSKEMPFPGYVSELLLTNYGEIPAKVTFTLRTDVEYPEVYSVPVAAISVVAIVLIYLTICLAAPKVGVIAAATSRQAITQPIFYLVLGVGAFLLLAFIYIPYNTFGEDVKMLKDSGLTLIMVLAIMSALWTASVSIADEIEGRTALMLLSKPVGRRQFIIGKFLGIVWPTLLLFVALGLFFLLTVSYKVVYDARESAAQPPNWQQCYTEMVNVIPGLILAFMETIVLGAISVAISTRVSMLANLVICSTVYVLGHLVPVIVQSDAADFPIVRFVGKLLATIFPVLEHFNIQADIARGALAPPDYLLWAGLYCGLYCTVAMLLALTLFEDRDLA